MIALRRDIRLTMVTRPKYIRQMSVQKLALRVHLPSQVTKVLQMRIH